MSTQLAEPGVLAPEQEAPGLLELKTAGRQRKTFTFVSSLSVSEGVAGGRLWLA